MLCGAPDEEQSLPLLLAGTALLRISREHEEEWGRSGAPHFQKGFQSLPQARETCGKGCQWWCPGQGWRQSEGPQFRHIPCMNLREERVKFPSSFQPRVFLGR